MKSITTANLSMTHPYTHKLSITVIIPTYNGENKISNILKALTKQTHKDFEVIVAIDGSTDRTQDIVNEFKGLNLKVLTQSNKGRATIRNFGARNAKGNLFVFFDDDMIPSVDSVKQHYEFHLQNENAILGGDQVENIEAQKTDIQNYKAWLTKKWTSKYTDGITRLTIENLFFTAANCSIPRNVFELLTGFDERLPDVEDFDFACRAIEKNIPVYFDHKNIGIHNDPITCTSYIKRQREYAIGRAKRNKVNEVEYKKDIIHDLKHILYRPFAFHFWVKLIDSDRIQFMPKRIRYKLYNVIIHSLSVEYPQIKIQ